VYFNADSKEGNNNMGNGWHQCVELCKRYVKQLNSDLNRKETDTWGNAINWPYNRKNETKDPDKYLVFDNDGSERVREGDLLVWKHGDYGHIGVVISVKADRISVAHQNGGTGTYALPIGTSMKLENGVIKDIVPNTNRSPIFKSIQPVTHFIRINSPNEHTTSYNASMTASTTNMAFTPAQVGKSITQTFIINNPKGMDKLEISSITLSRGDAFSVDVTNCSIEPGDAKVVRVTFTPSASGEYMDRIIIKSNADDNPTWAIHLTGSGI
jgi:surface antigen